MPDTHIKLVVGSGKPLVPPEQQVSDSEYPPENYAVVGLNVPVGGQVVDKRWGGHTNRDRALSDGYKLAAQFGVDLEVEA